MENTFWQTPIILWTAYFAAAFPSVPLAVRFTAFHVLLHLLGKYFLTNIYNIVVSLSCCCVSHCASRCNFPCFSFAAAPSATALLLLSKTFYGSMFRIFFLYLENKNFLGVCFYKKYIPESVFLYSENTFWQTPIILWTAYFAAAFPSVPLAVRFTAFHVLLHLLGKYFLTNIYNIVVSLSCCCIPCFAAFFIFHCFSFAAAPYDTALFLTFFPQKICFFLFLEKNLRYWKKILLVKCILWL